MPEATNGIGKHQHRQHRHLRELVNRIEPGPTDEDALIERAEDLLLAKAGSKPSSYGSSVRRGADRLRGEDAATFTGLADHLATLPQPRQKSAAVDFLVSVSNDATDMPARNAMPNGHLAPEPGPSQPMSMAARLRQHRQKLGRPHVPEHLLLRDAVYILQGIDGTYVRFRPEQEPKHEGGVGPEIPGYERDPTPRDSEWVDGGIDFSPPDGYILAQPLRDVLLRLGELGYCYRQVALACAAAEDEGRLGVVQQSLIWALKRELGDYYRTVAVVEAQIVNSRDPVDPDLSSGAVQGPAELEPTIAEGLVDAKAPLTLKRLLLHLYPSLLRLRLSAVIANEALVPSPTSLRGGPLLSQLYKYTKYGDPVVVDFMQGLLDEVSRPLLGVVSDAPAPAVSNDKGKKKATGGILKASSAAAAATATAASVGVMGKWIREGRLEDPGEEFFVTLNPALKAEGRGKKSSAGASQGGRGVLGDDDGEEERKIEGHQLWAEKFAFKKELLPSFISESFGKKIFSTGKSLNFIKHSCNEGDWAATHRELQAALPSSGGETTFDLANLERSISLAYALASTRLLTLFFTRFHLLSHLHALKSYLLLSKGDFVAMLLESLGPALSRPASTLFRHNLTATLETAVQGSTAEHPDVLRRLDVRMLEFSHGESGWDVLTLEYKVDAPLDTVLGPDAMESYTKVFRWLFAIKRVEHSLEEAWKSLLPGARTGLPTQNAKGASAMMKEVQWDLHQTRIVVADMIHFVRQLQAFCHSEVIDCAWQELEKKMHSAVDGDGSKREGEGLMDLDGLIEAHDAYLARLVTKILMTKKGKERDLTQSVREALRIILAFREAVDSLYNFALAEAMRTGSKGSGRDSPAMPPPNPALYADIRSRLHKYSDRFGQVTKEIVDSLAAHPDSESFLPLRDFELTDGAVDLRFLCVRLSFSNHRSGKKDL